MHVSHERTHEVIVHACVTRENYRCNCSCSQTTSNYESDLNIRHVKRVNLVKPTHLTGEPYHGLVEGSRNNGS